MKRIRISAPEYDFSFWAEAGRLRGEGKARLGGRQRFSFPLESINRDPIYSEQRGSLFQTGGMFLILGILSIYFVFTLAPDEAREVGYVLASLLALAGAVLTIRFIRPMEILTFTNNAGSALFHVVRTERNSASVQELVDLISSNQMAECTTEGEQASSSNGG